MTADMDARLAIDTGVLLLYFFGIVALGLWAGRRNKNLRDFSLGGRSIPWWAVLASIVAAETSAATFLGTPAEGFKTRGYFYGQLVIGTILARIVIAFTFIKPYYDYRVQSVYEFLTVRFGTKTKNMASGIFLFTRVLGIGVRLYLGGAIMVVIWRYLFPSLPVNLNTYIWGIIFVTIITTVYTAVGGIKAVVWTDLIQAVLMFSSVIFAIFLLLRSIPGGFETVKSNLGGLGNVKHFQTGWNSELPCGPASKAMMEETYTIFAALMGSTTSPQNDIATRFTEDFYLPYVRPGATDRQAIRAARIATAVFGVLMILVATMAANAVLQDAKLTIIPIAVGILGYTYGALVGVFLLGMLTRRRGSDGANVVGMAVGIMSVLILCKVTMPSFDILAMLRGKLVASQWNFGWFMPDWWPKISWPWFVFVGCVVTLSIAVLFRTPASQIAAAETHVSRTPV